MDKFDEIIDDLPPLNSSCNQLLGELQSEQATASRIEQLLLQDPVVAARTLHLANSSFYGFSGKIGSLKQAYIVLGKDTLSHLIISLYLVDKFREQSSEEPEKLASKDFDRQSLWNHSLYVGLLLSNIKRVNANQIVNDPSSINLPAGDAGFLMSLFHYIGLLALDLFKPQLLQKLSVKALYVDTLEQAIEHETRIDLRALNIRILEYWKLPPDVIASMASYQKTVSPIGNIMRVCKFVATAIGHCPMGFRYSKPVSMRDMSVISCSVNDFSELIRKTDQAFNEINSILTH